MWSRLFTPICALYLRYGGYERGWKWAEWLFAEVGARAWDEEERKHDAPRRGR